MLLAGSYVCLHRTYVHKVTKAVANLSISMLAGFHSTYGINWYIMLLKNTQGFLNNMFSGINWVDLYC